MRDPAKFWNPYLAGAALGLVLLSSYAVMGKGIGASGASYRIGVAAEQLVAPAHVASAPGLRGAAQHGSPLDDWLVFEVLGVFLGGLVGSYTSGRLSKETLRGAGVTTGRRLAFAFGGGAIMGVAARMARGCTSGQALSGGALLSVGSWAFMFSVFAGGYALAWLLRREWLVPGAPSSPGAGQGRGLVPGTPSPREAGQGRGLVPGTPSPREAGQGRGR